MLTNRSALKKDKIPEGMTSGTLSNCPIKDITVSYYKIPTNTPESDGTLSWAYTGLVLVQVHAGGKTGMGYSFADLSTALFIKEHLKEALLSLNALNIPACWEKMLQTIRNMGIPGVSSMAIAAVDNALWDLKARILAIPLARLFGQVQEAVEIYGSGGFTSYSLKELQKQMHIYAETGFKKAKMKIGREPEKDVERVKAAKSALGKETELFVDANGAYTAKQALKMAELFSEYGVTWFEEPVPSNDLQGLHLLRKRMPAGMNITAGEYGYGLSYFRKMLEAKAVDILQADATRCAGLTGFIKAATLAEAFFIPFSSHTAPAMHLPAACSLHNLMNMEYFYDHVRIENLFFEGVAQPKDGKLYPNLSQEGNGLELKEKEAEKFKIS